jgi:glycosyltransferase involved in cell wall biosynthesis
MKLDKITIKLKKITSINFLLKLMVKAPGMKLPKDSIIHGHRPDFMSPFIIFHRRIPKVCTLHGIGDVSIKTRKSRLVWRIYNGFEKFALKRIDMLIAVDDITRDYYMKHHPYLKEKIVVIPVGIDLDIFRPVDKEKMRIKLGFDKEDKIILYVGRFSVEKGLDQLLMAFKNLQSGESKSRLVLVGKGPQKRKLEDIVNKERIERVKFLSPVRRQKVSEIMNCADVLALTSSFEGMPTVVLEALACGVPVVATNVGDIKKVVINHKTGYLIRERNVEEIKDGLLKVIDMGREKYIDDCVNVVQRYSWKNIANEIMEVYESL